MRVQNTYDVMTKCRNGSLLLCIQLLQQFYNYWGTAHAKSNLIDTTMLFSTPKSDNSESDNDDDDDDAHRDASRGHKLDNEDEFLLFMIRLRLGLSVIDLSFRFSVSKGTVTSIIHCNNMVKFFICTPWAP